MDRYTRNTIQNSEAISSFSTRVYGWMSIGLGVTASVAYFLFKTKIYLTLLPFWWVWAFGTFGIAMAINVSVQRFSVATTAALFLAYATLEGVLFGTLLPAFAAAFGGHLIWTAFLTASSIFALATGYGIFTKNDLTGLGRILSLGLIGLIGITLVYLILSFFITLPLAHLFISYLGLVMFIGLTAYDAQTIRQFSLQAHNNAALSYKLSLVMALKMYVNVIMIFWYLLQIFSSNRK